MQCLVLGWIPTFVTIFAVAFVVFFRQKLPSHYSKATWWPWTVKQVSDGNPISKQREKTEDDSDVQINDEDETYMEDLEALKMLYHQLHNLEEFPEVLPGARRLLLSLLKETTEAAEIIPSYQSLKSVPKFSRPLLEEFQQRRDKHIGEQWEEYNLRRKNGAPREVFEDREEASWWLRQISPVKYVDGAWLGHVGRATTPFLLQKTVKGAWQILSEELGDGDLEKNHVYLYHKLLEAVAPGLPAAHELDFIHPQHMLNQLSVWKAATAQLLISLFPGDFLPEILGFNLHFEAISMDTLKAGKELREVGIDPYYFILHVSIDNSHSGHSAIALEILCEYLEYMREIGGEKAVQKAWEKVQAGYSLSLGLPGTTVCPSRRKSGNATRNALTSIEAEVIKIFRGKAQVVHGIHCGSKAKIGSKTVADWLNPIELESEKWQIGLLNALSSSKFWICRGDSSKSRFIRELQWNGRMFGSFTQNEFDALSRWVDSLSNVRLALEGSEATQNTNKDDILSGYPAFVGPFSYTLPSLSSYNRGLIATFSFQDLPSLNISHQPVFEKFLPLWLSHPSLLQAFVAIPFKTKNPLECAIVKILRAQGGFDIEQECVAGMAEVQRLDSVGLVSIGMNIMAQQSIDTPELPTLRHIIQRFPSDFAIFLLEISTRPVEYKGLLIGMATAFSMMHIKIAHSTLPILSARDKEILRKIGQRELVGLEICWEHVLQNEDAAMACRLGYLAAGHEIEKCFRP